MKYSNYQAFICLFIALPFILGLSKNTSRDQLKSPVIADNNLKDHFSKMIYIEGKEFTKGSTSPFTPTVSDSTLFSQGIPQRATVGSYYISATEVTNSEWKAFYNEKVEEIGKAKAKAIYYPDTSLWLHEFKYTYNRPHAKNYFSKPNFNNFPVVGITWDQARLYCQWKTEKVNQLLRKKGKKSSVKFRLPTENEWEFAAMKKPSEDRTEKRSPYAWPEDKMLSELLQLTNLGQIFDQNGVPIKSYADDGCLYTCEVASYPPNDYGIYNMAGNVSEWTADQAQIKTIFFDNYDAKILSTSSEIENEIAYFQNNFDVEEWTVKNAIEKMEHDKKILTNSNVKICKGGSWANGLVYAQPGSRQGKNKDNASVKVGFRIAISEVDEEVLNYFPKTNWKPSKK